MKKLSIITVCRNEEQGIEKTILSVLSQTCRDFEYLIIDGASTDNTLSIIKKYENEIDIIISEPDSGIYQAQNKGIAKSSGEYLLFLNGGDKLYNQNVIGKFIESAPRTDIVYGDMIVELKSGMKIWKFSPGKVTKAFMSADSLPHPSTFFRREIFEKYGAYNESFRVVADYEFFLRTIFKNHISTKYIRFPVSVFNYSGISTSKKHKQLREEEKIRALEMNFGRNLWFYKWMKPIYTIFKKNPGIFISLIYSRFVLRK